MGDAAMTPPLRLPIVDYPSDCERIQKALLWWGGVVASLPQCEALWCAYSSTLSAGWIAIDAWRPEAIYDALGPFFTLYHEGEDE